MRRVVLCVLLLTLFFPLLAQDFLVDGSNYVARGEAVAPEEAAATEAAKTAALRALFSGLRKDGLFAEVVVRDPPPGLSFSVESVAPEGNGVRVRISLRVDDESLHIVERGPYLRAAIALLDQAEAEVKAAESLLPLAEEAESAFHLSEALGRYGQAFDHVEAGAKLLTPLETPTIYSTTGGRGLLDLRASLATLGDRARSGVSRLKEAEASLAKDEASKNLAEAIELALAEATRAEALLEEERPLISDPSAASPERLKPLRDRLNLGRDSLADAASALERAGKGISSSSGYLVDKEDFARRRLATASSAIDTAYAAIDGEIRDPAVRRAARAAAVHAVFFHTPLDYLQVRGTLPMRLDLLAEGRLEGIEGFECRVRAEGAFGTNGGAWIRTGLERGTTRIGTVFDETALTQKLDLGFWGRRLFWLGYGWDWIRSEDGADSPRVQELRLGLGGVSSAQSQARLDWLIGLSYELPEELPASLSEFLSWDYANGGLEALFRLGHAAILEGELSARRRKISHTAAAELIAGYRLAFGLRLPPPFLWGVELRGDYAWPFEDISNFDPESADQKLALRFFLEYDL